MNQPARGSFQTFANDSVPPILNRRAKDELNVRKVRTRLFGRPITREVAWEMLLILYVDEGSYRNTIASLIKTADVPLTTALRWLSYLEDHSLVSRHPHPTDARRIFVELTEKGIRLLNTYFLETLVKQA